MKNNKKSLHIYQKKNFPIVAKDIITKKIVDFVCKDLRQFEIISGQDFRDFSQEMIDISSTYGLLQIDDLFSHPNTISRNIIKNAESVKSNLILKLKDIFEIVGGTF